MKRKIFFLFLLIGCLGIELYASSETLTQKLRGSEITDNNSMTLAIVNPSKPKWADNGSTVSVRFYLAEDRNIVRNSPQSNEVKYQITLLNFATNTDTVIVHSVAINYRPNGSYKDIDLVEYHGYKSPVLKVLGVSGPMPDDVFLELQWHTSRSSALDTLATITNMHGSYQSATNELLLTWGYLAGADNYDVEWLFVDNPTNSEAIAYNFSNATNVNVSNNYYPISLAYPKGTILYRVRGRGNYYHNGKYYPIYGPWSYGTQTGTSLPSSNPKYRYNFAGLEKETTWQYSATYAEEGKRKEVISFFDGTLRTRQQATLLNTNNVALVGETFYDHIGRQALQAIPAPTPGRGIRYYGTNQNAQGQFNGNFEKTKYDTDSTITKPSPFPATSGSAKYYSSENPFLNQHHWSNVAQTPTDSGYTYTHIRYLSDGTNRIHSQSNVGENFKLGSGKETKYYYGNPLQVEIDRLFGNEVGHYSHYQKVLAIDPNNETTVSYYDMKERLIASAIIPNANTSKLLPVDNAPSYEHISEHITFNNQNRRYTQNIVVGTATSYTFTYNFTAADAFADTCENNIGCIDCRYLLVFSLWDPDKQSYVFRDSLTTNTDETLIHTSQLAPGNYQLYKSVELINDDITNDAFQEYAHRQHNCVEYPKADTARCYTPCQEYAMSKCGLKEPDLENLCYLQHLNECENPPQNPNTECDIKRDAMLNDMSPGGQYFDNIKTYCPCDTSYDDTTHDINDYLLSICNERLEEDTALLAIRAFLEKSSFDGEFWNTLRDNWEDEYAEIMLPYHPEYFLFQAFCECGNSVAQHAFDSIFFNVNSFELALNMGLLNPLGFDKNEDPKIPKELGKGYLPFESGMLDPFFVQETSCCPDEYNKMMEHMKNRMFSYMSWEGYNISIWWLLFDPADIANGEFIEDCEPFIETMHAMQKVIIPEWAKNFNCSEDDARWRIFKSIYLYLKEEYRARFLPACMETCNRTEEDLCKDEEEKECCNRPALQWGQYEWWLDNFDMSALQHCEYYLKADTACPDIPLTVGNYNNEQGNFQIRFLCNPIYGLTGDNIMETAQQSIEMAYDNCIQDCEAYANSWMEELNDYFIEYCPEILYETDSLTWHTIREKLIDMCTESCGESLAEGNFSIEQRIDLKQYAQLLTDNCTLDPNNYTRIVYPRPDGYLTDCGCQNYQAAINSYELTFWDHPQTIKDSLYLEGINTTLEDIDQWNQFCIWERYDKLLNKEDDTLALYEHHFPEQFKCRNPLSWYDECRQQAILAAAAQDTISFYMALDSMVALHKASYTPHCLENISESLEIDGLSEEMLYTLYYYDQADNLIKTVPPQGVHVIQDADSLESIQHYRNNIFRYDTLQEGFIRPNHTMITHYKYNTLNQISQSYMPDHDSLVIVYYDILSRPVLSQNGKQKTEDKYSYILYDEIGRIIETGQVENDTSITRNDARDTTFIQNFINDGVRTEATRTFYNNAIHSEELGHTYLRNRIAAVAYHPSLNLDYGDETTTYYSYDIHGNVKQIVHNVDQFFTFARRYIRIDYDYDLISGNVNRVWYQKGKPEQWTHRYRYDADNKLTHVYTSNIVNLTPSDARIKFSMQYHERLEARYFYLPNGTLSRVETGQKQIQGTDYAYTLQGWLKNMNSYRTAIHGDTTYDIGKDGYNGTTHANQNYALDAYSTMLQYYYSDYRPIAGNNYFNCIAHNAHSLYNGNIAAISGNTFNTAPMLKTFRYDKLNRIKTMKTAFLSPLRWGNETNQLATHYTYDFNGNLNSLKRNDYGSDMLHNINYQYNSSNNRLQEISATGINDSKYEYDPIGNLVADYGEEIEVVWNSMGKVKEVWKDEELVASFTYSATGQRQTKTTGNTTQFYIHDAMGNVMCMYTQHGDTITAIEHPIYGSQRIGVQQQEVHIARYPYSFGFSSATIGHRTYEITDHLGNITATYSDRKTLGTDSVYRPVITSHTDYYPFGFPIGRRSASLSEYRYGFNGQESDGEIYGEKESYTAPFWQYDSRLGRRWNVDPKYLVNESRYAPFSNNPIVYTDPLGDFRTKFGARLYKWMHGGEIQQDKVSGEWFVGKQVKCIGEGAGVTYKRQFDWNGNNQPYTGSGWMHSERSLISSAFGMDMSASNLVELGIHSMLQNNSVYLTDALLDKVKQDPSVLRSENSIVEEVKSNSKYGKEPFVMSFQYGAQLGGKRGSLNPLDPSSIETWKVAANPLTWAVRTVTIEAQVIINAEGVMNITYNFTDKFDLRPELGGRIYFHGNNRPLMYNVVTSVTGVLYHDLFGGNDQMQVKATWTSTR